MSLFRLARCLRNGDICGANNISAISAISAGPKKNFVRFGKFGRFLPRRGTSLLMSRRNSGNSRNVFLWKNASSGCVYHIFAKQIIFLRYLRFLRDLKNIFECASRRNLSNHSNLTVIFGKFVKSNKIETARALLACYQRDARNRTEKKVPQK